MMFMKWFETLWSLEDLLKDQWLDGVELVRMVPH
jgi:hypothetical protein